MGLRETIDERGVGKTFVRGKKQALYGSNRKAREGKGGRLLESRFLGGRAIFGGRGLRSEQG